MSSLWLVEEETTDVFASSEYGIPFHVVVEADSREEAYNKANALRQAQASPIPTGLSFCYGELTEVVSNYMWCGADGSNIVTTMRRLS